MRTAAAARGLLLLAVLVGATGCGGDSTKDADPSTTGPSNAPATTPTGSPSAQGSVRPFPADTSADDGGHGSGNRLGLTDVRVGRHPGFDRVVFELGGTGTPGWRVEYTTTPRADGSGARVRLKGTVFLQVVLRGVGLPDDVGIAPFGNSRTRIPGTGTHGVAEVAPGAVFEGDQQAFIGLTGAQRPFRAFALTNPARVVVDVQDD
jgi:hypothetical protein